MYFFYYMIFFLNLHQTNIHLFGSDFCLSLNVLLHIHPFEPQRGSDHFQNWFCFPIKRLSENDDLFRRLLIVEQEVVSAWAANCHHGETFNKHFVVGNTAFFPP